MSRRRMELTDDQLGAYRRDGYLVVEGILTPAEAADFLTVDDAPPHAAGLLGHTVDKRFRYLAHHPSVTGPAAQILETRPYIVQTMYMPKSSGGAGIALHQDCHYLENDPNTLMACWIALTDTGPDNGGICVVPKSHTGGLRSAHKNENKDEHAAWDLKYEMRDRDGREYVKSMYSFEIDDLDPATVVHLTVPAGSGVFFNGLTIHGSYANRAPDKPRKAFAIHYVAEGTWLPRVDVQNTIPADLVS